jgi:hypothetical protein
MEQRGSDWTHFDEIWYSRIFRKSIEKFQVSLKCVQKKTGYGNVILRSVRVTIFAVEKQ